MEVIKGAINGQGMTFLIPLIDSGNRPDYKANPTLAAGDVKVARYTSSAWDVADINSLPTVITGMTTHLEVVLTNTEMTADNDTRPIAVTFIDAAGAEWDNQTVEIRLGAMEADVTKVNGATTPVDNIEDTYDGTGYSDPVAPAQQQQIDLIVTTGAATNKPASGFTLTTGVQASGTYADTEALDGTYHQLQDTAGTLDCYYETVLGSTGVPVSIRWTGRVNGNNDDLIVYAWKWSTSAWQQIGTIDGKTGSTDDPYSFDLLTSHVGTDADAGKVRIRFYGIGLTTANLYVDQFFISYSTVASPVGYANGAVWLDTVNGTAGAIADVNGVADFPTDNIADAITIAASKGLNRIQVAPGSSVTFAATMDGYSLIGMGWACALGGQSCSSTNIFGASVSGICTGAVAPHFHECTFGTVTLPPCVAKNCGFGGTITVGSLGDFFFDQCFSQIAGIATPTLDFNASVGAINLNIRHYSGGLEIENMGDGSGVDRMSFESDGQLIINANCNPTNNPVIAIRGNLTITDNVAGGFVSGGGVLSDSARFATDQLQAYAQDWGTTEREMVRDALGVAGAKTTATGGQLQAIGVDTGTTIPGLIGTPVADLTTDIAGIQSTADDIETDTQDIQSKIGTPVADLATDIAGVQSTADAIETKIGTPSSLGSGATLADNNDDMAGATFSSATDSLEVIRDRGDAAWVTGADIVGLAKLATGTAQAGASGSITLAASASIVDDYYKGEKVVLTGDPGAGQARIITGYTGSSRVATIAPNWKTNPTASSTYELQAAESNLGSILTDGVDTNAAILRLKSLDFDGGAGAVPAINLKGGDAAAAAIVLESDTDVIHQTCKTAGGNVLVATAGSSAGDCYVFNAPADAGKALDLNGGPVTGKGLEADGGGADIDAAELVDLATDIAGVQSTADDIETDTQDIQTKIGTPVALDGGLATVGSMLTKMADDNGGLDFDATIDSLHEISAAASSGADWLTGEKEQIRSALGIDGTKTAATGGQLQSIQSDVNGIETDLADGTYGLSALRTAIDSNATDIAAVQADTDDIQVKIGTPADIDGGGTTLADNLKKLADDNGGTTFDATTDSQQSIRAAMLNLTSNELAQWKNALGMDDSGTAPVGGDLQDVEALTIAIKAVTDLIPDAGAMTSIAQEATLGTPTVDIATDIATVLTAVTGVQTEIDDATYGLAALKVLIDGVPVAMLAETVDGSADVQIALTKILAYCSANIARVGTVYTYRNYDDTADEMVLTGATDSRTRS